MGRAKVQRIKHEIIFSEETFPVSLVEKIAKTWVETVVIRQVGEAAKGALSHPVGFLAISAIITSLLIQFGIIKPQRFDIKTATTSFTKSLQEIDAQWRKDRETNPTAGFDYGGIFDAWIEAFKDFMGAKD
jgi:hypothetical protein